jgi:hypothetical protein
MKFWLSCLLGTMALMPAAHAQGKDLRAITEDGRKVLLGSDGRWRFDASAAALSIPPAAPAGESPYKTILDSVSLVFDTKKWSLTPNVASEPRGRRNLRHNTLPLYGAIIAEEFPGTLQAMRTVILSNARTFTGMEPTVLFEETKTVQQRAVGNMKIYVAKDGVEFIFTTRFHANEQGNVQLTCWTAQALFHKYEDECQKLLDGLTFQ